jgi:hypothetical protein
MLEPCIRRGTVCVQAVMMSVEGSMPPGWFVDEKIL